MAIKKHCSSCGLGWDLCTSQSAHRTAVRYVADVQPGGRKGKRIREQFLDHADAVKWEHKQLSEYKQLVHFEAVTPKQITVNDFINVYWEQHCQVNMRNPHIVEKYRLKKFGEFFGGPLVNININMADKFVSHLLKTEKVKPSYINRLITSLKAMCEWGTNRGYFAQHPLQRLKKLKGGNVVRERWLTDEEIGLLLSNCNDYETRECIMFGVNTGFRKENIVSIDIEDIHLDRGFIKARKTKSDVPYEVPILDSYLPRLRAVIGNRTSGRLFNITSFIFGRRFRLAAIKAGLYTHDKDPNRVTPHVLRHTYASHMLHATKDIYAVKEWLGHSSIKMTEQVYAHLWKDLQRKRVSGVTIGPPSASQEPESRTA